MPRGKGQWADLTGRKFGRLTVIGLSGIQDRQHAAWECRCDCGNAVFTSGHKLTYAAVTGISWSEVESAGNG